MTDDDYVFQIWKDLIRFGRGAIESGRIYLADDAYRFVSFQFTERGMTPPTLEDMYQAIDDEDTP